MRKLAAPIAVLICLFAAQAADAAITTALGVSCTTVTTAGPTLGQRHCGAATGTLTPTWDGTPIDVSVTFPPATGADNNYPVIGVFHGWAGSKITPTSSTTQRWVQQGYAVFSMTDRGFFASCGILVPVKPPSCANGYIHLLHNEYEVRDAQYLLGRLADQGLIDPQRIGATGGSYGGGMAAQLGALKDRTMLTDGSLIQWRSPAGNIPMKIAATAPEFTWTDLAQSLQPNGSSLDYVADAPYKGMQNDHRFGIQKQNWTTALFAGGQQAGFYAPTPPGDPKANLISWNNANSTGGPYDGVAAVNEQMAELPNHSAYYTDMSEPPAPALFSNGWNDDLFPVDENIRYYNKVRSAYPNAAIKLIDLDFGHTPNRAASVTGANPDVLALLAAENAWMNYYVRGVGGEPAGAHGGVDIYTSVCPINSGGAHYSADNWASLAPGEIRLVSPDPQTIAAPGTAPSNAFVGTSASPVTVCSTQAAGDNASDATYKTDPAPAGGYTVAGSPTVIAEFNTIGANDMIAARLYDVDPADGQRLVGRALYRPTHVGDGFAKQVFQVHPQAWKVVAGHYLKLELATRDDNAAVGALSYARLATGRNSIQVRNLELRIPTIDPPGSAGGMVVEPADKYLPPGYTLARDVKTTVPGAPHITSGDNPNATGAFSLAWDPSDPATDLLYALQHRDSDDADWSDVDNALATNAFDFTGGSPEGEGTWKYRVNAHESDGSPATDYSDESAAIKVDKRAPNSPNVTADRAPDYSGGNGWYKDTVDVSVASAGDPALLDGSDGSGVDVGSLPATATYTTSGSHVTTATAKDAVGNESEPASLTVQVDATDPSLAVTCPSAVLLHASGVEANVSASDGESGLDSDPSGTVAIDTSSVGPKTVTRTATDNVGHSTTESCTTQVQYMYSGVLQPINPDGSSIFKLGSTVPVKFALTDADAAKIGTAVASLSVAKVSSDVEGTFVEASSTSNATTGSLFRYDASSQQYIFNLSTKGLSTGTWSLKVTLDDDTSYTTRISLR
jgi:predicted acyl esterase